MAFIQNHIQNRSIYILMLVTLLCIATVAHALPPLVIVIGGFAIRITVARLIGLTVSTVLAGLTIKSEIQGYIKTLDEKIADLETDLINLQEEGIAAENDKKKKWSTYKSKVPPYNTANAALSAAETAVTLATSAEYDAYLEYQKKLKIHEAAYKRYQNHYNSCNYCQSGSCSEVSSYLDIISTTSTDKTNAYNAWQAAKATLESKEEAKKEAQKAFDKANKARLKAYRPYVKALVKWNIIKEKIASKNEELTDKRFEHALNELLLTIATGGNSTAKPILEEIQSTYPDQWQETLDGDEDLRVKVEEILNDDSE